LSLAYLFLTIAYFALGSIGTAWFAPIRNAVPLVPLVAIVLALPALGVALVKPSVVGTTARASKENVRSVGYSIYYTLVNVGSTAGPFLASWVHRRWGMENVFRMAAISVFAMLFFVLLFFKEPRRSSDAPVATLGQVARNFLTVLSNPRFMLFLLIFTGYWIVFWQEFIALPLYISGYIDAKADTERILITDPLVVICFTMVIGFLTKRMHAFHAIVLGTLVSSVAWVLLIVHPSVWMAYATLAVVAIGEIIQQPRYYDYVSRLAPPDQQGTYMGFAFLPLGIGSFVGGPFSGWLMHHFGEERHQPQMVWWSVIGVGLVTTLLLWIYDRVVRVETGEK
jgi:MFS family permease